MRGAISGAVTGGTAAVFAVVMFSAPQQFTAGTGAAGAGPAPAAAAPALACAAPSVAGLTASQVAVARRGAAAADRAKVGDTGAAIIVATGLVESGLADLDYGDRDSIGWLQQRPSTGWAHAGDVDKAADDFFTALKAVRGWQQMDPGMAAQRVQRSAHPERYGARMQQARGIVSAIRGTKCATTATAITGPCPATGSPAERGLQPKALNVLRCGAKTFPAVKQFGGVGGRPNASDHPYGRAVDFMIPGWSTAPGKKLGWDVANWTVANAPRLGVKYVIFDDRIWRPSGRKAGWQKYTHPNGPTANPTLRHLDHVHVSVTP